MSFFFFKQKTAYEMRISDWSSDVCSSDLRPTQTGANALDVKFLKRFFAEPGRLSGGNAFSRNRIVVAMHRDLAIRSDLEVAAGRHLINTLEHGHRRSEERRVGKECGRTGRSRWSP